MWLNLVHSYVAVVALGFAEEYEMCMHCNHPPEVPEVGTIVSIFLILGAVIGLVVGMMVWSLS